VPKINKEGLDETAINPGSEQKKTVVQQN